MAATPIAADPIDDMPAPKPGASPTDLDELNLRVSLLDEEYNATWGQLEEVEAQLADAEAEIGDSEGEHCRQAGERPRVRGRGLHRRQQARPGGRLPRAATAAISPSASYLQAATGDKKRVLEDLRGALEDLDAEVATTESIKGELDGLTAQLDERSEEIESVIAEQSDLLAGVESELAELIPEEQERWAAEAAAAPSGPLAKPQRRRRPRRSRAWLPLPLRRGPIRVPASDDDAGSDLRRPRPHRPLLRPRLRRHRHRLPPLRRLPLRRHGSRPCWPRPNGSSVSRIAGRAAPRRAGSIAAASPHGSGMLRASTSPTAPGRSTRPPGGYPPPT